MEYKKAKLTADSISKASKMLRAVGHPLRLAIVEAIDLNGKMTVSEVMEVLKKDQVSVSKALSVLKTGGLVVSEKCGNTRIYSVSHPNVINLLNCVRKHQPAGVKK